MAEKQTIAVPEIIDNVEALEVKMQAMREAQKIFATFTQEQVDKNFLRGSICSQQNENPAG